jgi:5-hydroxyisourate hydrolase
MSAITTHVLDTAKGRPAASVTVSLKVRYQDFWREIGHGTTDEDGRLRTLLPEGEPLSIGTYQIVFDTASYFARSGVQGFYPEVAITFEVREAGGHYHVPLLLSPYGYSTYRGS